MQKRPLGKSGISASSIAFGAWAIGGWKWGGTDKAVSIRAIHAALDAGIDFIDTAPIYGQGTSEAIVGEALKGRRDQVVIATKCGMRWDGLKPGEGEYFFTDEQGIRIYKWNHPASVRSEVESSLRRLDTDYIDLYQTHWQEQTTPVEDTMALLMQLRQEGKIRAIGACNTELQHVRSYRDAGQLDTVQENFSMLDQQKRGHFLSYTQEQGIGFLAYSPMAFGLLSGKMTPDRTFPETDLRHNHPRFTPESREQINGFLAKLQPWKEAYGLTTAQLIIAWTAAVPGITHVLTGIRNADQALENARPGAVQITPDDFRAIDNLARESMPDIGPAFVRKKD